MVSFENLCIISAWSICLGVVSYNHDEFRLVASSLIGKACGLCHLVGIIAHVGDACKFAGFNHALDFLFVGSPVWLEHARSSRHGEHIGICSKRISLKRIQRLIFRAVLHVVILYECDGVLTISWVMHQIDIALQLRPVW